MRLARIDLAINTALEAHRLDLRKAGGFFAANHAVAVGGLVAHYGFSEDAVIAAFLHDTLEDTALDPSVVAGRFGDHVLAIVLNVTAPRTGSWRERKIAYMEQVGNSQGEETWAVVAADKIHNLHSLATGFESEGRGFAEHFEPSISEMVWYQRAVYRTLSSAWDHDIMTEHRRHLDGFIETVKRFDRDVF